MTETRVITAEVERVARAICIADNCDPDADGHGMGHLMPQGARYKLWEARVEQAIAAMEELMTPSEGMSDAGYGAANECYLNNGPPGYSDSVFRAMLLRALGR